MAGSEVDCERLDVTVLVVDDDTTTLSIIANILRSLEYKVATATNGHEALATLREFRGFFDIVITDLNMQGMNGFELQKRVKREFKLPVIIMSADSRKSVISKSLEHGAAFYLVKPVSREDFKDIWQYAVAGRKEKLSVENDRIISVSEGDSSPVGQKDLCSQDSAVTGKQPKQRKKYSKRKGSEVINEDLTYSGTKRSKIVWTTSLHNRFLLAIRHIGMNKAVPKKILEIMNVPGLTRENVASHLQKYRIFLRKVAEKGILEGLSERALRSRFAIGLPTALIRDIQKRVGRFRLHEHQHHQPFSRPQLPSPQLRHNPPTTRPSPVNQTRLAQPTQYGTNQNHKNCQQLQYHGQPNHHHRQQQHLNYRPILPAYIGNGGYLTSANALTGNGIMSNYGSLGNISSNFNYGLNNYNNDNNNLGKMIVPYGSSGLQRSPSTYYNQPGTQLINNLSLMVGTMNQGQNVGYIGHNNNYNSYGSHKNDRFGLICNGSATNNTIVPVSSSGVNVRVQPTRGNIPGFPSLTQQSINGVGNVGGGGHNQHNAVTSMIRSGPGQFDDLNELFLMIDDMYLLDKPSESPRAGERSNSEIFSSFNVEDCLELMQEDGENVNTHARESSISVLPNKCSIGTNENPDSVLSNVVSTNSDPLDMPMVDKANSPAGNSITLEQDWDFDLIETLFGAAADSSQKA